MKASTWVMLLLVALLAPSASIGGDGRKEPLVLDADVAQVLQQLQSPSGNVKHQAYREIVENRQRLTVALREIAAAVKPLQMVDDPRELAVQALGELRDERAVDLLIPNIARETTRRLSYDVSLASDYPVAGALVRIGTPAVTALLLSKVTPDDPTLRLHAYVIQKVDGSHEIGALRIRKALREAVGSRKTYLTKLLEIYKANRFVVD